MQSGAVDACWPWSPVTTLCTLQTLKDLSLLPPTLGNTALHHTVLLLACWGRHNLFPPWALTFAYWVHVLTWGFATRPPLALNLCKNHFFSPSAMRPADYNQWLDKLRWNAESISILSKLVAEATSCTRHTCASPVAELWSLKKRGY